MPYFHPAIEDEQWLQKHTIKLPKPKQPLQCSHSILLALPSSVRCGISISESDPILNFISWNLHGSASWALVKEYLKLSKIWNPCLHFTIVWIGHTKALLFCGLVSFCCGKLQTIPALRAKLFTKEEQLLYVLLSDFPDSNISYKTRNTSSQNWAEGDPRLCSPQL